MELNNFMELDPNVIYKFHVIHEPGEMQFIRNLHYKKQIVDNISCQYCEDEKIQSRFEILDL